jgi:hypothetical protein
MAPIYFICQEHAEAEPSSTTPGTNSDASQFVPCYRKGLMIINIYVKEVNTR